MYTLNNSQEVYVGESLTGATRLRQHLEAGQKKGLVEARVIIEDSFNKSACLDLESVLISMFSGEGVFRVLNGNAGIANGNYFQRDTYRECFNEIFDALKRDGLFSSSIEEIRNSDLYKLSPFKSLNADQTSAVVSITQALLDDLRTSSDGLAVIEGGPGTGKTVVAIFLMKLLLDLGTWNGEELDNDHSAFRGLFRLENSEQLKDLRIGLVVPQQALRKSVQRVFRRTPGLHPSMVLRPGEVGLANEPWDLLIVDEAHRLMRPGTLGSAMAYKEWKLVNASLFGDGAADATQWEWIKAQSHHQLLLLDIGQRVRPSDLTPTSLSDLKTQASRLNRLHRLTSQMRVEASDDFVEYVRGVLSSTPPEPRRFPDYDLRFFDNPKEMIAAIQGKETEHGLSRVLAGYAWDWVSRPRKGRDPRPDFVFGELELRWNGTTTDWVSHPNSVDEVGSIHTIQGYDLNYAGVLIGRDLRYDPQRGELSFDKAHYFDRVGSSAAGGRRPTEEEMLELVTSIYGVLLTRGIRGTYIHVVDEPLRQHLRRYF